MTFRPYQTGSEGSRETRRVNDGKRYKVLSAIHPSIILTTEYGRLLRKYRIHVGCIHPSYNRQNYQLPRRVLLLQQLRHLVQVRPDGRVLLVLLIRQLDDLARLVPGGAVLVVARVLDDASGELVDDLGVVLALADVAAGRGGLAVGDQRGAGLEDAVAGGAAVC